MPSPSRFFLGLLIILTALGPMSMQIFLPSLPLIQASFGISVASAQLVFSLSGLAMACGTLLYGPLSDRFGRRPTLMAGLVMFMSGSLLATLAPTIELLIFGRIVQAVGGIAGMVLARTIVRDIFDRERSAQMIAYLTLGMVVLPMVSPTVGGIATDLISWRATFALPGLIGIAVVIAVWHRLHETNTTPASRLDLAGMGRNFLRLLRNPAFVGYAFQGAFSMAVFFAFLAGGPFVVQEVMGAPPTAYGLWFVVVSAAFMAGNLAAARLSPRLGLDRMIMIGMTIVVSCTTLAVLVMLFGAWTPANLFLPMSLVALGQGMAMPNSQAGALSVDPTVAGTASGLAGFLQMGLASLIAQGVGMIQNGTPYPLVFAMALCGYLGMFAFIAPSRVARAQPA